MNGKRVFTPPRACMSSSIRSKPGWPSGAVLIGMPIIVSLRAGEGVAAPRSLEPARVAPAATEVILRNSLRFMSTASCALRRRQVGGTYPPFLKRSCPSQDALYCGHAFMAPNRPLRPLAALAFAGIAGAAFAAPRVPLEDFAHDPDVRNMQLSPDGQYVAFLHDYMGHPTICSEPVGTSNVLQFDLGIALPIGPAVQKGVSGYTWIGDDRLLLTTNVWNFYWYGTVAANRDAKEMTPISGLELIPHSSGILLNVNLEGLLWASQSIYKFYDEDRSILMLDDHSYNGTSMLYPDVVKVNSFTGGQETVMRNPGNVRSWGVDHRGQVRIRLADLGGPNFEVTYREDDDSPWRKLGLPKGMAKPNSFQFDSDNKHIFVSALSPEKRKALYRLDPDDEGKEELVASDPEYDVIQEEPKITPYIDGIRLCRSVFSEKKGSLLGVWYLREAPRVKWFDKDFAGFQRG